MKRIERILNHNLFMLHMAKNEEAEKDREFCRHDMVHLLDVARIALIMNLEENIGAERAHIYAAALLHDLGKHIQYEEGIPHEEAARVPARQILSECGFEDKETDVIISAIARHRTADIARNRSLDGVLYRADKASRACYACKMEQVCDWKKDKKNMLLKY